MKNLNNYRLNKRINEDKDIDFEEYLDIINDTFDVLYRLIEKFEDVAGNIPDNDLSNKQFAIKDFINKLSSRLDLIDKDKLDINLLHSVNILK